MIGMNDFLSIYGLFQYDQTVFDNLALPAGVDKTLTINNLIMDLAELELLYPDANFMRQAIGAWSQKQLPGWERAYRVLNMEYNPLWNKDGTITETASGSDKIHHGQSAENRTAAYNDAASDNYHNHDITIMGGTDETELGTTHVRVEQGNIGVTSSQQLLREEIAVSDIKIIDIIVQDFKKRFCIAIY